MRSFAVVASVALNAVLLITLWNGHRSSTPLGRGVTSPAVRPLGRVAACARADGSVGRRAVAGSLGIAAPILAARNAMAILPDDDDAELLEKAKARRSERIKEEKKLESDFLRAEGITNKKARVELVPVTRAVARLADLGKAISEKNLIEVSTSLSPDKGGTGGWIQPLMDKVTEISTSDASKSSASSLQDAFNGMTKAASNKDVMALKKGYVTTVTALERWAIDADVAEYLRAQ